MPTTEDTATAIRHSSLRMSPSSARMVRTLSGNCQETLELRRQILQGQLADSHHNSLLRRGIAGSGIHDRPYMPKLHRTFYLPRQTIEEQVPVGRFTVKNLLPEEIGKGASTSQPQENAFLAEYSNEMEHMPTDHFSSVEYMPGLNPERGEVLESVNQDMMIHTQKKLSASNLLLSGLQSIIPGTWQEFETLYEEGDPREFEASSEAENDLLLQARRMRKRNHPQISSLFHFILVLFSILFSLSGLILIIFDLVLEHSTTRLWNGVTSLLVGLQWAASGPYSLSMCSVERIKMKHRKSQYASLKSPMELLSYYHVANWLYPQPRWPIARTTLGIHTGLVALVLSGTTLILHTYEVLTGSMDILPCGYDLSNATALPLHLSPATLKGMFAVSVVYKSSYCIYSILSFVANSIVMLGLFANLRGLTNEIRRISVLFLIDATIIERAETERLMRKLESTNEVQKESRSHVEELTAHNMVLENINEVAVEDDTATTSKSFNDSPFPAQIGLMKPEGSSLRYRFHSSLK
ncbi:hypothetical protein Ciccas_004663 [Cichlidogyrus casuarinus]|uniref:Uncharacterized protein n=1 Tax=Cichlidogyrus casuarinus TaxID=1844966 RepID=A0ABD2QAX4_9PLAT